MKHVNYLKFCCWILDIWTCNCLTCSVLSSVKLPAMHVADQYKFEFPLIIFKINKFIIYSNTRYNDHLHISYTSVGLLDHSQCITAIARVTNSQTYGVSARNGFVVTVAQWLACGF